MRNSRHGNWYVDQELAPAKTEDGLDRRRRYRRSGFANSAEASKHLNTVKALLSIGGEDNVAARTAISEVLEKCATGKKPLPDYDDLRQRYESQQDLSSNLTVGEWLDKWLKGKKSLRKRGADRYDVDIRCHLKPHLGDLPVRALRVDQINEMFDAIASSNIELDAANKARRAALDLLATVPNKGAENRARRKELREQIAAMPPFRRLTNPPTHRNILATLRAALNVAIGQRVIPPFNPCEFVELARYENPKALLWTPERVEQWKITGEKPSPVMVWTPEQVGAFLDYLVSINHRLYALFHVIAFRGLRRGEACGLRWSDIDWDAKRFSVAEQLGQDGWDILPGAPKTRSGVRTVALDIETSSVLRDQKRRQAKELLAAGNAAANRDGRCFTEDTGEWLHPGRLTDLFEALVKAAGLPPIRLHDLRHVAATLALAAKVDIKIISEMLGHSSTTITRDIYQTVMHELAYEAAEAVVAIVPRARRRTSAYAPEAAAAALASFADTST
ncbi:tyrosine-type recombinase/integrase [Kitasatospora sp. NPDC088346]|uniref:tyrosine-type recombinase/integrase n=1 Tax=Kitasatospora sp. NPDC088346 TaxID=3364073 RepID=UPI0038287D32